MSSSDFCSPWIASIGIGKQTKTIDLSQPMDLSIPVTAARDGILAWYLSPPQIKAESFNGNPCAVAQGSATNCNTITFNPHAHGTHTECVGHITAEFHQVQDAFSTYFYLAKVISVSPKSIGADYVIQADHIREAIGSHPNLEAVIIRTLPNPLDKKSKNYSNTNWPYLCESAAIFLKEIGIKHLLIDLPSVDKEKDDGKLLAHKAFWNFPKPRLDATITEMVYVPDSIADGIYVLNLQLAPFQNDAAPSRPLIFTIRD